MKQEFLNKLVGLECKTARAIVLEAGYECWLVPEICGAISQIARPNTVILWQKNGRVESVQAGDPLEIEA